MEYRAKVARRECTVSAEVGAGMAKKRSDGAGSVFRRASDGRWVAQIRTYNEATGESRITRRYTTSRDAARAALAELQAGTAPAPRTHKRDAITVADWLDVWAERSLPVAGLKPTTVNLYRALIRHPLKPTLGAVRLDAFTPTEAEAWLQRMATARSRVQSAAERDAGKKPPIISKGTQRNAYNCLKRALDAAVRDGLLEANPLTKVARPVARRAEVPVTSADAVDSLILPGVADLRVGPLVTLVALTGCRVGEAAGLRWADVDLDAEVPTVTFRRSGVGSDSTKTGTVRTVPLLPEVVESLRNVRKQQRAERLAMGPGWQDTTGLVFTSGAGTPMNMRNARRDLARVLDRNGLPTARPFHSLRHGLASRLLARNLPLPVVSAILGHSSVRLTADLYGHVQGAAHADAFAAAMGR